MKHAAAALLLFGCLWRAQDSKTLTLRTRVELPDVAGRIDHFSADLTGNRLFIAALGNQTIEVLDVRKGKRLGTIRDVAEPQGVLVHSAANRLFVACRKDGTVKIFEGGSLKLLETVNFSGNADNLRYDARHNRVIVGYGGGALGFLDPDGKKIGEIPLGAHPESFQLELTGTRAFINVPGNREVQVADLVKNAIVARWPLGVALQNYPMALDEKHRRLLIGCRLPARMHVIDIDTGKRVGSFEIARDTDDLFYDSKRNRVYVIGGGGSVDVLAREDSDHYTHIEQIKTAPGARTGLFVAEWAQLFVAVPQRDRQRCEVLVYDAK